MGAKGTEPSCFHITASSPSHNSFSTHDDQHITISYPPEDHCTTVASHSDDHHITISAPYHDHWSTILPNLIEHKPPPSFTLIPRLFISRISYRIYCGVLEHDRLCIENNIVCVAYQIICVAWKIKSYVWHVRSDRTYGCDFIMFLCTCLFMSVITGSRSQGNNASDDWVSKVSEFNGICG